MKMLKRVYISALLLLGGGAAAMSVHAEERIFESVTEGSLFVADSLPMSRIWTYDECVERALAFNTDIRQTLISILSAEQDILSAKDSWLPTVDFSTNHGYTNFPVGNQGGNNNVYNSSYGVQAGWTVWEGNIRKYRYESAELMLRQQQLMGEDLVKDLKLNILQAYLNILYSRESIAIARQTLEVSTAQTARMKRLVESGRESKVDLAQIESQRAQDEYNVTQAQSELQTNLVTLKRLMMLGLDTDIDVEEVTFSDAMAEAPIFGMEESYKAALAWIPSLKQNTLAGEIAANDVKIAKAGKAPVISLQGGVGTGYTTGGRDWGYQMGHGLNENVGVSLSLPLYDANKTKRAEAKARLSGLETEVAREQIMADLAQTIESLYVQARNAEAKFESGKSQLAAMEETSRLVDRQFELGLVNTLELLTAHNNLLNARLEQLRNKYMAVLATKTIGFYATQKISMP